MAHRKSHHRKKLFASVFLLLLLSAYTSWALLRPLGSLQPITADLKISRVNAQLTWPVLGQSAVGIVGTSILDTNTPQTPIPTASTAKVITALLVLEAKPLKVGEQGPLITITANDVALYNAYKAKDGSVVAVQAGEQISEYQALQTLMLPSANNMADTLATWAYGSLDAYKTAANAYLTKHDTIKTTIGSDASGLDPSTTSTATDLVRIGELAVQHPVLAQIVGQSTADNIPVAGTIRNVNFLIGSHNIIGVKTGNTDEAGGAYISASQTTVNNKPVTIVTALMGAPDLFGAMNASLPFIDTAQANFKAPPVIQPDTIVGYYTVPWTNTKISAVSQAYNASALNWGGSSVVPQVKLNKLTGPTDSSATVGHIILPASGILPQQTINVTLAKPIAPPTTWWRLTHPV